MLFSLITEALLTLHGFALLDLELTAWVDDLDWDQTLHGPRQVLEPSVEVQKALVNESLWPGTLASLHTGGEVTRVSARL